MTPSDWQTSVGKPHTLLFSGHGTWSGGASALLLYEPERVLTALTPKEVPGLLDEVEAEQRREHFVAGYLSYEAGSAFGLSTHPPSLRVPLAWMGVYSTEHVRRVTPGDLPAPVTVASRWLAGEDLNVTRSSYEDAIGKIRELIAAGDTYQVNYTCHARFSLEVHPWELFLALLDSHPVPYAAYLDLGEAQVLSVSPELFLSCRGEALESRPMKGTIRRGRTQEEDMAFAAALQGSEKDRAENLMITDMVRNDLGRICRTGSVRWPAVFSLEKYRSLWQMTSTVMGEIREGVGLRDVFEATFPGASVTGAPKHRTMEIIRDLEPEPRGLYTGAIGLFMPGGDFTCNLAIRTLVHQGGCFDLGLGGGIVWDSRPDSEYEEVLLKSRFLSHTTTRLTLFETMLLDESRSYRFAAEHLERLSRSAEYWDFPFDLRRTKKRMTEFAGRVTASPAVVRLELRADGSTALETRELPPPPCSPVRLLVADATTDSADRFLYHKTSHRAFYDAERAQATKSGFAEVMFANERGCVTEGAITNLFARFGARWVTPPVLDGLLPGIWRECFARQVGAQEQSLSVAELQTADEIVVGNSVRGSLAIEEVWSGWRGAVARRRRSARRMNAIMSRQAVRC